MKHDKEGWCVKLIETFQHKDNFIMVFESLGPSMYMLLKKNDYKGLPLKIVQQMAKSILKAVGYLHSIGIIHTDLKPENILIKDEKLLKFRDTVTGKKIYLPEKVRIKLIDFGTPVFI